MNENEKLHYKSFLDIQRLIYFDGLSGYLGLFQKKPSASLFKNNKWFTLS